MKKCKDSKKNKNKLLHFALKYSGDKCKFNLFPGQKAC